MENNCAKVKHLEVPLRFKRQVKYRYLYEHCGVGPIQLNSTVYDSLQMYANIIDQVGPLGVEEAQLYNGNSQYCFFTQANLRAKLILFCI